MLKITIPETEFFNEETSEFVKVGKQTLQLEHSLVSLAKWESKWKKPFLSRTNKTREETLDYIKCMTLTQNVNPMVYSCLTQKNYAEVEAYITDPMTATTFSDKGKPNREIITAEILYYDMIALNIPFECQKWHLNRLIALIRVCSIKNTPSKKIPKGELARRNRELNAARRKAHNTQG